MKRIEKFRGEYRFLSNFWMCAVEYMGIEFPSAEHAYQASKAYRFEDMRAIAELPTAGKAKRAGRKIIIRRDWNEAQLGVMQEIVLNKFLQNPELGKKLVETGDAELVEGNHWHDNFWGSCGCINCGRIAGKNHLGKILMNTRRILNEKY